MARPRAAKTPTRREQQELCAFYRQCILSGQKNLTDLEPPISRRSLYAYRSSMRPSLIRTLSVLLAIGPAAMPQTSDVAQIERRGDSTILSVNTFRPLDA